jgi:hypothetical protein
MLSSPVVHASTELAVLKPSPLNPAWIIEGAPVA